MVAAVGAEKGAAEDTAGREARAVQLRQLRKSIGLIFVASITAWFGVYVAGAMVVSLVRAVVAMFSS